MGAINIGSEWFMAFSSLMPAASTDMRRVISSTLGDGPVTSVSRKSVVLPLMISLMPSVVRTDKTAEFFGRVSGGPDRDILAIDTRLS